MVSHSRLESPIPARVRFLQGALPSRPADAARRLDDALRYRAKLGRRAIRIVHAGCGRGRLLVHAIVQARLLGFVAIEGRGFDVSPEAIGVASRTTADWRDPRIGLTFEVADIGEGLAGENEGGTDIFLCSQSLLDNVSPSRRATIMASIRLVADRLVLTE